MTAIDYLFSAIFIFLICVATYCVWSNRKIKQMWLMELSAWSFILFVVWIVYVWVS